MPRTEIVTTNVELWRLIDPTSPAPNGLREFFGDLRAAVDKIGGLPIFLRTGHGSGKHDWSRTCHVNGPDMDTAMLLMRHVCALVEWSEMVDMMGLPTKVWAVREFLPLLSSFTSYNHMPVAREFRLLIEGGQVRCVHPYWPKSAVHQGGPSEPNWRELYDQLFTLDGDEAYALTSMGITVAEAFADDGAWSLDFAQHQDGRWFAIDMAPAEVSWHWPGCEKGRGKGEEKEKSPTPVYDECAARSEGCEFVTEQVPGVGAVVQCRYCGRGKG